MKILIISEDFLPYIGGISHHVVKISKALAGRGHDVSLLVRVPKEYQCRSRDLERVRILPVHTAAISNGRLHKLRHLEFLLRGFRTYWKLARSEHFDVVHWHGLWSDNLLARLFRRSGSGLVFTNHSSRFLEVEANRIKRLGLKAWLTRPDICISPSRELAEKYQSILRSVSTLFIPNGVDIRNFGGKIDKKRSRKSLGLPLEGIIVACPRRLCEKNGVHFLVNAIPHIDSESPVYFAIAGSGPMERELKKMVSSINVADRVIFLGAVEYAKMPSFYGACDCAVFPSLKEATSLAALEALAAGLPVVASAVGGLVDLLHGSDAGFLVEPAQPLSIAEALNRFIADASLRNRAGMLARQLAENYSWEEIARRTESAYLEAISSPVSSLQRDGHEPI